jgi:hypothetical protein
MLMLPYSSLESIKRLMMLQSWALGTHIISTGKPSQTLCDLMLPSFFVCIFFFLHSFTHYHVAPSERSNWALPGTEHLYNPQQDSHGLSALRNVITPRRLDPRVMSTTPNMRRQVINRNIHANGLGHESGDDNKMAFDPNDPSNLSAAEWEAKFVRLVSDVGLLNYCICSLSRAVHYK